MRPTKGRRYRIIDFLRRAEVVIHPDIQQRARYPFNMTAAKRFFDHFAHESFSFDRPVKSILIHDGKENYPQHSYANGFLFSETADEIQGRGTFPDPVGEIYLEVGGTAVAPKVKVTPLKQGRTTSPSEDQQPADLAVRDEPGEPVWFQCPSCKEPINVVDVVWTCPKCHHTDHHWAVFLNCESCGFNPDDETTMACPSCSNHLRVMAPVEDPELMVELMNHPRLQGALAD